MCGCIPIWMVELSLLSLRLGFSSSQSKKMEARFLYSTPRRALWQRFGKQHCILKCVHCSYVPIAFWMYRHLHIKWCQFVAGHLHNKCSLVFQYSNRSHHLLHLISAVWLSLFLNVVFIVVTLTSLHNWDNNTIDWFASCIEFHQLHYCDFSISNTGKYNLYMVP